MTARRRGVALTPMETRLDVIVQTAVLADKLGYEVFALPEGWGLDSATVLTKIALGTRRIQVASSVLSVWGRTPAAGDNRRHAPPDLGRAIRARPRCEHQGSGGGIPRRRVRGPGQAGCATS